MQTHLSKPGQSNSPPLVIIVDVLDISSPIAIPERKMKANVQVALVTTIEIIGVLVLVLVVETILIEIEADPEIETIIAEVITIGIAHPILAIAPIAHLLLIIETYTIRTKTIPQTGPLLVFLNGKFFWIIPLLELHYLLILPSNLSTTKHLRTLLHQLNVMFKSETDPIKQLLIVEPLSV
jgi:hypothetical protein